MITILKRPKRQPLKYKRIRIHNIAPGIPLDVLEDRIEEMAEREEFMSRYEHGQEIG